MSSASVAISSICSHNLRRNIIYGDYQQRHRTSSSSFQTVAGGLTHLPRLMTMSTINPNFLSSSSSTTNRRTSHIRNAIENLPAGAPLPTPPGPPPSGWFSWIIWTLIPVLFPLFKSKMSPLLLLKQRVDTVIDIVDDTAELIEDIAEEVVKITDHFEDKVPDGSTLKNTMCAIHEVAQQTIKVADLAEDLIDKGEALEEKMKNLLEKQEAAAAAAKDQAEEEQKKVAPQKS
ncbi:hypothetical protein C5167_039896 [Papaver somniferum]|uniref:Uncharacterized protein n=1 Tax=Papaver somniferum TaxID=3469 RepID=A0A4Y7IHP3_PAPSO|nr:uncharacterized protein LOC113311799 [Papaver somniferum]RZC46948.1 hypothetical protein C5167_039896 [Papaver somniferum]